MVPDPEPAMWSLIKSVRYKKAMYLPIEATVINLPFTSDELTNVN